MQDKFIVKVWGARGSIPSPGPATVKYGGNTSCLEVRCGDEIIILDAGTGIRELGKLLLTEMPIKANILFSHLHWDHIQGFPFFTPFYQKDNKFNLFAERKGKESLEKLLSDQMRYPFYPVPITTMPAKMEFNDIKSNQEITIGDVKITSYRANHPDGCLSYRIDYGNKSLVYATDTEHRKDPDKNLLRAAEGTDIFIYDCNYTEEEYKERKGWGHSTWIEGIKLAREAGAKKLILWHHDPYHNDQFIDNLEETVRNEFSDSQAAYEGLTFDLT